MKKKKEKSPIKWRHRHPKWARFFKFIGRTTLVLSVVGALIGLFTTFYVQSVIEEVPQVTEESLKSDPSSNMYDKNGDLIWSSSDNKRVYVEYEDLPQQYIDLLLATEQKTFFEDPGFSPKGLANAFLSVVKKMLGQGEVRGGSSLEQQLIKLTVFSVDESDRTIERKIKEFYLANQLEENYDKETILEYYVNKLPMSENSFGVETLAMTYYNKPLKDLTLSQIALMVGTGQAPSLYNVYDNPDEAKDRRDMVLEIAYTDGLITKEEYDTALAEPIDNGLQERFWQTEETNAITIQYDGYVQSALNQLAELGYDIEKTPLQIYTALDPDINDQIKDVYDNDQSFFQSEDQQSAVTAVETKTGRVIAQVGGRYIGEVDSYNRATQTVRSTGSSTKPLFYGIGMDLLGWGTNKIFDGSDYTYAGTNTVATNYGNVKVGQVALQEALRLSHNTTVLRAFDQIGLDNVTRGLEKFGLTFDEELTTDKALGINASTADVASAFAAIGNTGLFNEAQYVTKIVFSDKSERTFEPQNTRAFKESTAYQLLHVLKGTSYLQDKPKYSSYVKGVPQAMKSGTVAYDDAAGAPADAAMDMWTASTTPSVSIAVWHGYDEPMNGGWLRESIMNEKKLALHKKLIQIVTKNYDNTDWKQPGSVQKVSGNGLSAYYEPIDISEPVLGSSPTTEINSETSVLFSDEESVVETVRGDEEYEQIDDTYKLKGWTNDVEKESKAADKSIKEIEEEQASVESSWQKEKENLESIVNDEQKKTDDTKEKVEERMSELESEQERAKAS